MDKHFKSKMKAKTRCFGVIVSPWSMQIRRSLLFFAKSVDPPICFSNLKP